MKSPNYITPGIDYICITDNPRMKVDGWQMRLMPFELFKIQENKRQRVVKIRPDKYLPEYDVTLWVDGNIDINCNIFELLKKYPLDKSPLYICQHKQRNSIAEEAEAVIKLRKDLKDNVDKQMRFYRSVGYSCNTGLIESNIILRDNRNKACIKMQEIWEKTLLAYSHRDQLSFNYACWKTKFSYATFKDVFRVAKTTLDFKVCPHIITEPTIAIVSVNYNTSRLINLWLRSLFKQQTDISKYKVFVFDKSDKEKLVIDSVDPKRVEIIDNTTGKYVDFNGEVFLNMCKTETENHHASMRHCYAIQWLLDNIDADSLVLFDSDTILKKPLDFLAKRPRLSKVSIFGTDHNKVTTRAVPFMQYFNLNLLKCANIRYFDPTRIRGGLDSNNSAIYDTGTSFYEDIIKSGLMRCCELISVDDYISHLQHGSWVKNGKSADIKSFIESNRQYL